MICSYPVEVGGKSPRSDTELKIWLREYAVLVLERIAGYLARSCVWVWASVLLIIERR